MPDAAPDRWSSGFEKEVTADICDTVDNELITIGTAMTAEFAGISIKRWRIEFGADNYPDAREILIGVNLDESGVNAFRMRAWGLQGLSELTRLRINVSHYPAGI